VSVLIICGIFTQQDILNAVKAAAAAVASLRRMVVGARWSRPVFSNRSAPGFCPRRMAGKRFLLGVVFLVSLLCAFLPNATTVILLAPIIIRIAKELDVDFVARWW